MTPDRFGWAMKPYSQRGIGPALSKSSIHGPAYLTLPHDTTRRGIQPGGRYFQQDVLPRAGEAARVLRNKLSGAGIVQASMPRRLQNAMGIRFTVQRRNQVNIARRLAANLGRRSNLSAVLVHRKGNNWAIYFTDVPSMVLSASQKHGMTASQVAGVDSTGAAETEEEVGSSRFEHYGLAILSGTAAGAVVGSRQKSIGPEWGAALGAALGTGVAAATYDDIPEAGPEARKELKRLSSGQPGRLLTIMAWGPLTLAGAYAANDTSPAASVALGAAGTAMIASSAREYAKVRRLKRKVANGGGS